VAWLVFEVSKNWGEADADIAETIDFCELYAREALRMANVETPTQLPGEPRPPVLYSVRRRRGRFHRGNFPCAIMAGMTLHPS